MELLILYFNGFPNNDACLSLKIVFIFANIADPCEMAHCAAFHLGLHSLPNYLFTGIQNEFRVKVWEKKNKNTIRVPNSLDPNHRHFAGSDLGPNGSNFILGFENLGRFL